MELKCEKCGKEYTRKDHYEKHITNCGISAEESATDTADIVVEETLREEIIVEVPTVVEDTTPGIEDTTPGIEDDIIAFFNSLKVDKFSGGYRHRRKLTRSEKETMYKLYNKYYKVKEKICNTCPSKLSRIYDKLKLIVGQLEKQK